MLLPVRRVAWSGGERKRYEAHRVAPGVVDIRQHPKKSWVPQVSGRIFWFFWWVYLLYPFAVSGHQSVEVDGGGEWEAHLYRVNDSERRIIRVWTVVHSSAVWHNNFKDEEVHRESPIEYTR